MIHIYTEGNIMDIDSRPQLNLVRGTVLVISPKFLYPKCLSKHQERNGDHQIDVSTWTLTRTLDGFMFYHLHRELYNMSPQQWENNRVRYQQEFFKRFSNILHTWTVTYQMQPVSEVFRQMESMRNEHASRSLVRNMNVTIYEDIMRYGQRELAELIICPANPRFENLFGMVRDSERRGGSPTRPPDRFPYTDITPRMVDPESMAQRAATDRHFQEAYLNSPPISMEEARATMSRLPERPPMRAVGDEEQIEREHMSALVDRPESMSEEDRALSDEANNMLNEIED